MIRWRTLLRYDWPLHFILFFANWLPDNVIFLRLRGFLARPFLGKCGVDLRLGRNISFYNPSKIEFGAHIYLAYGCVLLAGNQPICLHDEVTIGPYCVLASENHTRKNSSYRYGANETAPVFLGSGVWLGAHTVVTAGAIVGSGTLVAAGAVVTDSIPDNVLAGGIPARVLKGFIE